MPNSQRDLLKHFSTGRIMLPVLIGLAVTVWLIYREFNAEVFSRINWTTGSTLWIGLAVISVVVRDLAYMVRIRELTDNHLNWYRSFIVIMLWEFSSALAPGMIGGGFLFAIFILNREGVNMGKSITAILNSSFLDGVFLAVMAPLVYWTAGKSALFSGVQIESNAGSSIFYTFWTVYFIILAYKLFVAYALFINPYVTKNILVGLFSIPILKRWQENAITTGEQLIIASKGLRNQGKRYWTITLTATFASWTARYSIVNCIIHAFDAGKSIDDYVIYGKQVIMGIIILLSPTPGGSGIAEYIFTDFLGGYIAEGLASTLSVLWRLLSYYPYIIIGVIILPRWLRYHVKLEKLKL